MIVKCLWDVLKPFDFLFSFLNQWIFYKLANTLLKKKSSINKPQGSKIAIFIFPKSLNIIFTTNSSDLGVCGFLIIKSLVVKCLRYSFRRLTNAGFFLFYSVGGWNARKLSSRIDFSYCAKTCRVVEVFFTMK